MGGSCINLSLLREYIFILFLLLLKVCLVVFFNNLLFFSWFFMFLDSLLGLLFGSISNLRLLFLEVGWINFFFFSCGLYFLKWCCCLLNFLWCDRNWWGGRGGWGGREWLLGSLVGCWGM